MSGIGSGRWAPASGIVFVVLNAVVVGIGGDFGDTDEEILSYYADSGNRGQEIAAFFLVVVAVLFFLWFLNTLRNRLRSVEPEPGGLSALAFGAGVASAAVLVAAAGIGTAISFTVEDTDQFVLDPSLARFASTAGYLLLVASTMIASVLVAATSALALRAAALPKWLGWIGLVVALALLAAIVFAPLFVFWAWILVVSVVLIVRPKTTQPGQQGLPAPH